MSKLLSSLNIGAIDLDHRIVLGPDDRPAANDSPDKAGPQRWISNGGLLYSPAFEVSPRTCGHPPWPLLDDFQVRAHWERQVARVHRRGGLIVAPLRQLAQGVMVSGQMLRQLDQAGIDALLRDYARAARAALAIGFDGVELLADEPQLPYQFLHNRINTRLDCYGGSIRNRLCFLLEAVQQLADSFGMHRVGVRFAPEADADFPQDTDPLGLYRRALQELFDIDLAYAHLRMRGAPTRPCDAGDLAGRLAPYRAAFPAPLLLSSAATLDQAANLVHRRVVDAVVFEPGDREAEPLPWMRSQALLAADDAEA